MASIYEAALNLAVGRTLKFFDLVSVNIVLWGPSINFVAADGG
jgi:hypothetical protein